MTTRAAPTPPSAPRKSGNARVAGKTLAEFVAIMDALHLPKPKRIDEAVPANLTSAACATMRRRHWRCRCSPPAATPATCRRHWPGAGGRAGEAVLVDVRTDAEREWVGFVPDAVAVAWKQWPGMAMNPNFDAELLGPPCPPARKLVLLCRSGVRSIAAAKRATELGLEAYNILEGFEGDPDEHAHRGHKGGWRMRGLPWRQRLIMPP